MRSAPRCLVLAGYVVFAAACGGAKSPPAKSPPPSAPAVEAPPPSPAAPKGTVSRAAVREAIKGGLGVFLQNVTVEDWPAMKEGKFHGFRLKTIRADWGVDLKPGDVIMRVNGMPIERPEQADAAMRSLENAKSIRVDLERDGAPRVLEIPIVDG